MSHPTWVRGLKPTAEFDALGYEVSHPTWVRGLKHQTTRQDKPAARSHPTWVRGLKQMHALPTNQHLVAPYVGAWIETFGIRTA